MPSSDQPERKESRSSAEPDLAQDLRLMLAELRRAARERERTPAHDDRAANAGSPLRIDPHAARDELRVGEKIGDRVDRPCRDDRSLEGGKQLIPPPAAGFRRELALEFGAVCDTRGVGREARVVNERVEAEGRAEARELPVVANGHDQIAV